MASGLFSRSQQPTGTPAARIQIGEERPHDIYLNGTTSATQRAYTPVDTTHSKTHVHSASLFDVGILKDTLAPSLTLHSGLAVIAYGISRYTQRVEVKDWLWPSGQVVNAWWSAIGRRLAAGLTLTQALHRLSWHERVVLTGVTLWGGKLIITLLIVLPLTFNRAFVLQNCSPLDPAW